MQSKTLKVSIHQPSYFPWLGLLNKIARSDLFVLLDTVPLNDAAYQHRNHFLTQQGQSHLLTIPVRKKGYFNKPLQELEFAQTSWQKKHWNFLQANYAGAPFWSEFEPQLRLFYKKKFNNLGEALTESMRLSLNWYQLQTPMVLASDLNLEPLPNCSQKVDRIMQILKVTQATHYLSGEGARVYQDKSYFVEHGIELEYQSYYAPKYLQSSPSFISGLSGLDALMHLGCRAKDLL